MTKHSPPRISRQEKNPAQGPRPLPPWDRWRHQPPALLWALALTLILVFGQALPAARFFSSPEDYLPLHTILELLSIAISGMVFALAWSLRHQEDNAQRMLLGAGFLAVCLIDLAHTLSYAGMPNFFTPSNPEKAINFWLAGRYVAAGAVLAVLFLPKKRWSQAACHSAVAAALALATGVWWLGLVHDEWLPRTFIPGQGLTPLKIGAEYLLSGLYGTAGILLWRHSRANPERQWLAAAAWIQALAEMFFTLYADVTDLFNLLGHVYKAIAYLMVYRALFVAGVQAPYRELEIERSRLQTLLATIPDPVWLKDENGVYLSCNLAFEKLHGKPQEAIIGRQDKDLFDPELAEFFRSKDLLALSRGEASSNEEWVASAFDGKRLFETTKTPLTLADSRLIGVLGIAHDITEQRAAAEALRLAATTFESQEGIIITDAKESILRVNRAFSQITGYSAAEAEGQTPRLLKSDRQDPAFYSAMWQSIRDTGGWHGEVWNRRKNGEVFPQHLTITAVTGNDGSVTHYVANLNDLSERKAAADRIEHLSFYDPLTQLPNRKLMFDRLGQALHSAERHKRQGALLLIDLDNFKTLNDTQGHDAGDRLLVEVAERLKASLGQGDTAARVGGDEFVAILEDLEAGDAGALQAETLANQLLAALCRPYELNLPPQGGSGGHHCSSSIGITLFRNQATTPEELLKRADTALYEAKAAGRHTLRFFDPQMQAAVSAHAALEVDLRQALAERQFLLHYQPQVDSDGRVLGAEALVRWQHAQRGLVSPAQFIPLAEENGLIVPLGQQVLETACCQLARWAKDPAMAHLTLAVNVSARQFGQPDFVRQLQALLARSEAPPHRLKLELTESLLLKNADQVIGKMFELKALGLNFSLDDFGTGYSSLSYLKRLPLDQLKIDQSFVRDVLSDPNDAAIARTVVSLGHSLGLAVIAEGVETEAQRDFLAASGCHLYQGYFYSRPIPLQDFERYVRQR